MRLVTHGVSATKVALGRKVGRWPCRLTRELRGGHWAAAAAQHAYARL